MRIKIDSRLYAQAFDILGRAGEREYREIDCEYPSVAGAQIYKLRFELVDGSCYELDITSGNVTVPYSLLAHAGLVRTQFLATAVNSSGNYTIIAKSNVFYCIVAPSIDADTVEPVPTYEESQKALERLIAALDDYEAKTKILTQARYDALDEHDPQTVYYVLQDDVLHIYLGNICLATGGQTTYEIPAALIYRPHRVVHDLSGSPDYESEE